MLLFCWCLIVVVVVVVAKDVVVITLGMNYDVIEHCVVCYVLDELIMLYYEEI